MAGTILVPESVVEAVENLVRSERLPLEVVREGEADVRVVRSEGRVESDGRTLQSGGWIACPKARAVARKLDIDPKKLGKLLDVLDIRVRDCELGCF